MGKLIKSRTTYSGVSDYIPYDIDSFTQSNLNEVLYINEELPKVDEILKVCVSSEIIYSRLVKTSIGTSLEGQKLTGWKYIIEGIFNVRVDYCGITEQGSIHTFKRQLPFNGYITLPEDTSYNCRIIDSIFIEDIFSQIINEREVLINISYLFTAEEC